jgi:hypothetical protein
MLQTLKRTYDDVMAGLGERFDALDMRDRDDYLAWMAQVHYIVRHSTRLLALASAYTSLDRDEVHQRLLRHAAEEMGHDALAKRDISALGGDVATLPVLDETAALVRYQYDAIQKESAVTFYGYILLLEGLAITKGPALAALVEATFGARAATFLKVHVEEDEDHVEKAFAQLAKFSDDELRLVTTALERSGELYARMLAALAARRQVLTTLDVARIALTR